MGMTGGTVRVLPWLLGMLLLCGVARGEGSWRAEFDEVCAKTTDAMSLPKQELKMLVEQCNRIDKALAGEDATVRKVFTRRVQMCRDLFKFVLETKEAKPEKPEK